MSLRNWIVVIGLAIVAIAIGVTVSGYMASQTVPAVKPETAVPAEEIVLPSEPEVAPTHTDGTATSKADPLLMSLSMKTWTWKETSLNDATVVTPAQVDAFTVTFAADGSFGAMTDCNSVGGQYVTDGPILTFSQMMSTEMYCEGSQEADFVGYLSNVSGYHFTTKGELILDLKFDSGNVILR